MNISRCIAVLLVFPLLLFSQCSKGNVSVNVDLLSFFNDDDTLLEYGEDPVIPGYGPEVSVKSPTQVIPVPDELSSNSSIEEISILLGIKIENLTGEADAEFSIFACEEGLDPFLSPPILEQAIVLAPDTTYTLDIRVEGDDRFRQLFRGEKISLAAELTIHPGECGDDIKGSLLMQELFAVVSLSASL
jgi:hypothetical protein